MSENPSMVFITLDARYPESCQMKHELLIDHIGLLQIGSSPLPQRKST